MVKSKGIVDERVHLKRGDDTDNTEVEQMRVLMKWGQKLR